MSDCPQCGAPIVPNDPNHWVIDVCGTPTPMCTNRPPDVVYLL